MQSAVNTWSADGGCDEPKSDLFALDQIATSPAMGFRSDSTRIIVWFGDAPSHSAAREREAYRHRRHLQACIRSLRSTGWQQHLAPLAQHMAARHLVRSRRADGAPLRRLDPGVLRDALAGLLAEDDDDGLLVFTLVVENAEPAAVAQERGGGRAR